MLGRDIPDGLRPRWAPSVADTLPRLHGCWAPRAGNQLSWRAAAQADMDTLGLHESRVQCYYDTRGVGQTAAWDRAAAKLPDLPHLGYWTTRPDGTIRRYPSVASAARHARCAPRVIRPRQSATTSAQDAHGTTISVGNMVQVTGGSAKYRGVALRGQILLLHSFSSPTRCRLEVGGGTKWVNIKATNVMRTPVA